MFCPSYALGAAGLLPRIDPFGEHCLSGEVALHLRASCAAIMIRGSGPGTRRVCPRGSEGPRTGKNGFGHFCRNKRDSSRGDDTPHFKKNVPFKWINQ